MKTTTRWNCSDWSVTKPNPNDSDTRVFSRIKVKPLPFKEEGSGSGMQRWLYSTFGTKQVKALTSEFEIETSTGCLPAFNLHKGKATAQVDLFMGETRWVVEVEYFGWKGSKAKPEAVASAIRKMLKKGE